MGNTRARVRHLVVGTVLALPVLAGLLYAAFGTSLVATFVPATGGHSLTWEAVTASSNTQASWYVVYRRFGDVSVSSVTGTQVATTNGTSLTTFPPFAATWSYAVFQIEIASGALSAPTLNAGSITSTSPVTNVAVISHVNTVTRGDAAGGQSGQGQSWTFTYKLNADADVSFAVFYPSWTVLSSTGDTNGLFDVDLSSTVKGGAPAPEVYAKRILNKVPRSDRMAGDTWSNTDTWDVRDSNGTLVPNGIYNIIISAYRNGSLLGSFRQTIPVDVLRITNPAATAITDTIPNSTISYNLTGNATVRVLVATSTAGGALPQFTLNSASDVVLSVGATVQIITEAKAAGSQSTIWNGLDLGGVAVSSGQYAFAISAKDTSGNGAVGPNSNDYFITGSIAVNRTPPVSNLSALTQVQNLNVSWAPSDKSATLSWDTAGAGITYSVFRKFGIWRDTTTFFAGVSTVATGITAVTYKDTVGPGTWTYGVRATSGTTSGGPISAMTAETSRNRFIRSISAVDGLGGQLGQGGKWIFSYKIEDNAEVDLIVLSTSTLLGTDADGFATYTGTDVVKVVISSGPRASEGSGSSWTNSDTWDQTNTAGVQVSSGIYTVLLRSRLPGTSPYYPPALRDVVVLQVPVTPAPPVVGQVQNVSVAWAPSDKSATVSWTALSGATGYTIYRKFGIWTSTASFMAGVSTVTTGVVGTSYKDTIGPGAWSYGVLGEGVVGTVSSVYLDTSKNRFIQSLTQVDGVGGQLGQGGKWTFTYKVEDNANVDIVVLSSNSLLGTDANGFSTYKTTDVVKIAVSSAPRAGMGSGGSIVNTDVWDQTDASGAQVSSGIYTVLFQAHLSTGNPYLPPVDRDVIAIQVPVVTTSQQQVGQVQGLTVTWAPADKSATLSWTALAGATGYSIYRKFGIWNSTSAFFTGASTVTTGVVGVTYKDTVGPGAWTYGVRGEGVGGAISAVNLETSKNRFIRSITQVDGNGGQSGLGGKWIFSYKVEDNANLDIIVLSSNSLLGVDANGFSTYKTTDVVKVVITSAPRASEGSGSSWINTDTWDQTDTGGVQVSSGIYTVLIQAHVSGSNPYYPPADRDVVTFQVPVLPTSQQQQVGQVQNVVVTWAPADKSASLTWAPLAGVTGYTVLRKYGVWLSTSSFFAGASTVTTNLVSTTYKDTVGPGAWTYGVKGEGVAGPISSVSLDTSKNRFIQSITRVDGTGGDQGTGGKWTFGYKMEDDAYVDVIVLSSGSLIGLDANGFATYKASDVVKIVVSSGPRAGMGINGSVSNSDVWDQTNTAGVQVSSGIYTVLIQAHLSAGNPFTPPVDRDVFVFQVPVNAAPVPPVDGLQVQNVKATWNNSAKTVTVTWDTSGLGFLSADTFTLFRKYGVWKDTTAFFTSASTVASGSFFFGSYTDVVGPGTYTYGVRATRGQSSGPISLLTSESTRNRFIQTITRVDGAGGQEGQGGKWTFNYTMEDDAAVDIIVLSSNSLVGLDANGFATYKATDIVKTVISSAPRSGLGTFSFFNSDVWDMKDANGVAVSSGIYTVLIQAHLSAANPYSPPADRDVLVFQIPVNATPAPASDALQVQNVAVTWGVFSMAATIRWDTFGIASDTFTVYRKFGVWRDTTAFFTGASTIAAGNLGVGSNGSYTDTIGPGTYTYGIRASRGGAGGPISLVTGEATKNRFFQKVTRVDGVGGQEGQGGKWTFNYMMEEDAYVDIIVLSSNSLTGTDGNGFATYKATDVVRVIISTAPRSAMNMNVSGNFENVDVWDMKDNNGIAVSSGIYVVLFQAHLPTFKPWYPPADRDVLVFEVPVNATPAPPNDALQVTNVKAAWDPVNKTTQLSWSTDGFLATDAFTVFRKFGIWKDTSTFFTGASTIAANALAFSSYKDTIGPGTYTYGVRASRGQTSGPISLVNSDIVRNRFIHDVTMVDGTGGQLGLGSNWTFNYQIEGNALVDLIVLTTGSYVGTDANGFATYKATDVVKVVVSSVPRAVEGWVNSDNWDQRDAAGLQVSSGIYTVLIQAHVLPNSPIGPPADRDVVVLQVPVNANAGAVSTTFLGQVQNVRIDWDPNERSATVAWDSVAGADGYTLFRKFGVWTDTTTFFVNVTTVASVTGVSFRDLVGPGAWTYGVRATKGGNLAGPISPLDREFTRNRFIRSVTSVDGSGSQLGFGGRWSFTYKMEDNALVDVIVLSSNSIVGRDANGLATYMATDVVKVVVSSAPRAFQGIGNDVSNTDSWDQTNTAGVLVSSGIYTVLIQPHIGPSDRYYNNDVGTGTPISRPDRDVYVFQVPVNTVLPAGGVVVSEISGSLKVTYTHGVAGNGYSPTLIWKAPAGQGITYRVIRASGSWAFPVTSGIVVGAGKEVTFADFIPYTDAQDWTYLVEAALPNGSLSYSNYAVLPFLHDFTRGDANGQQVGFGQRWKWTYKMLQDAYVTMAVYPATSTFTYNARGQITGASTDAVKTVLQYTPRSFEMLDKSFSNADIWDERNSTGAIVPNGLYNIAFVATDVTGRILGSYGGQAPVDTLRIMDVSATGISQTGGGGTTANVSYTLTGAATVRLIICKASTTFTLDAFGDPQPVQGPGVIISTITFARNPGVYTEIWNGLDPTGKAVPNDLYVFALSAKDGFGNFAVTTSSNDFYVAGTIPIDRTQQQPQADITPPNVTATNPLTGAIISPFTSVAATLVDPLPPGGLPPPTGVNFSSSVIRLTGPAGNAIAGTTSVVGTDLVYTLSDPTSGAVSGLYVMRVTPMDNSLNTGATVTVSFTVTLSTPVPPAQIQGLSVTWSPTDKAATISWTAIGGASGYTVYRKFGVWTSTSSFVVGVTTVATGVTVSTYKDVVGPGTWTYGVRQEGVGGDISSIALETSRNRFIRSVSAVDGVGGQLGKGGSWTFSYRIEDNANVDIIVLSSNSQVGYNANGFATYRSSDIVKTIISSAPRAGEGTGGWTNTDTWNLTDNSGVAGVPPGIYPVLIQAHLPASNQYAPSVDRDVALIQVTIDKTPQVVAGDSSAPTVGATNPKAGAKLPRVIQVSAVLADTGGSGVNFATSTIVLTIQGSTVPLAGVLSNDGINLYFTLAYSSDGAVSTTYNMIVTPKDNANNTGTPAALSFIVDATSPTIVSVSPSTGPTASPLTATFTTVSVKLSDLGGAGLDLAGSQITLTNPSGAAIAGTVTNNGTDTLTLTIPEQKFNGTYTVSVTARDLAGNTTELKDAKFTLNVPLSATTEEFGKTLTVDQNPARAPITVSFDVPAAGDSTFEVFNLLGERVYSQSDSWSGGGNQKIAWSLVNNDKSRIGTGVYTYRVRFTGGGTNLEAKKKLVVVQ